MSTLFSSQEDEHRSINLSKIATILAVVFAIAFGLCSVSAITIVGEHPTIGSTLIWISVAAEVICLLGLLIVGVLAIIWAIRGE